jgi:hypothetical protein
MSLVVRTTRLHLDPIERMIQRPIPAWMEMDWRRAIYSNDAKTLHSHFLLPQLCDLPPEAIPFRQELRCRLNKRKTSSLKLILSHARLRIRATPTIPKSVPRRRTRRAPHAAMTQNPNGLRVLYLFSPAAFLLLPIATVVFILERISQVLFNNELRRNYRSGIREITLHGPSNSSPDATNDSNISLDVNVGPTLAILGVSVFALFVGVLACCGIWELRRVEGSPALQRFWSWTTFVANVILIGLCVGVLAWASAVQGREGWKGYEDVGRAGQYFTRETWTCQIHKFYPQQSWAGPVCGLAVRVWSTKRLVRDTNTQQKATRFMLIPLAVSALLVMVSTCILTRDRGGTKWLFGGKGRYGGFASVYEMGPQAPAPPYQHGAQFHPMPQQYPGPQQYWASQQYHMPQQYPVPFQAPAQAPKDGATTGERAVFR